MSTLRDAAISHYIEQDDNDLTCPECDYPYEGNHEWQRGELICLKPPVVLHCPECDPRPFLVSQKDLEEAEGVLECEYCGKELKPYHGA